MRKLLSFLLLALVCLSSAWAQQDTILVSSAQELKEVIQKDQYAKIRVTTDIDISNIGKIRDNFSGVIIGGYLMNDSITGELKVVPHILYGKRGQGKGADHYLFETVQNARFENIAFGFMRVQDEDNNNLGVVARKAVGTTFRNFSIVGCSVFCNKDNAGAIAGVAENCIFEMVRNVDSEISVDGICVGGLVGTSNNCQFISCGTSLRTHVFADGRITAGAYAGGFTGKSNKDYFFDCVNYGWVCGDEDKVGGIVGETLSSNFLCCYNRGNVLQCPEDMFVDIMNDAVKRANVFSKGSWITDKIFEVELGVSAIAMIAVGIAVLCTPLGFGVFFAVAGGAFLVDWLTQAVGKLLTVTINGHDELGAIAGNAEKCIFEQCVNAGNYCAVDNYCGGIVGYGVSTTINNCHNDFYRGVDNLANKPNRATTGSIIGYAKKCTITNNSSNTDEHIIGEEVDPNGATGYNFRRTFGTYSYQMESEMAFTYDFMKTGIAAYYLNSSPENKNKQVKLWRQNKTGENIDYAPVLDADHDEVEYDSLFTTIITSADQLVAFAENVNSGNTFARVALGADIDLSGIDWDPIGNDQHRFRGIFDGKGHTIHNLKISGGKHRAVGLFGEVETIAMIRNVILADDCEINSTSDLGTGSIVGCVHTEGRWGTVTIEKCGSYATIKGTKKQVGGILGRIRTEGGEAYGRNIKVLIQNCFYMGNIKAKDSGAAFLVGYAKNHATIQNCWVAGKIERFEDSDPYPCATNNSEFEYFAGYEERLTLMNCYAIDPEGVGIRAEQKGVSKYSKAVLANGHLTLRLNGYATEGDLVWHQKIGEDANPMLTSRGGDIVYSFFDKETYYTNDSVMSSFFYHGPLRLKKDKTLALLDGDSQKSLTLNSEWEVGRAELSRSFKANVPSTLVLPFSGEMDSESNSKFFTFSAMNFDEESNKYTAVMDEVEGGKYEAYTPYLALFAEDADSLVFDNVTLKPVVPAVTQQDEWYFIGATDFKMLGLDDEENQYYYGYAGMTFDGFKLGEFARLGDGATIAPFRCYMRHMATTNAPDIFDVMTRKAPTRAQSGVGDLFNKALPQKLDVILKGANGETGIATFDNETGEFRFEGWYDLNGNRVEEGYQGVRVGGGKKVMIKEY